MSQIYHISLINFRYQKKTKETGKGIVFMYNENENNDLGRMTPEEHKEDNEGERCKD